VCTHSRLAGGYSEKQIRMGERAFGNLHEQSTIFLAAVWLHALFVDAGTAATLGWAWLGFRFAYVAIWALTAGNIMPAILLATMPMYGIIIWLFATVSTMRSRCQLLSLSLSLCVSLVRSLTQHGLHGVKTQTVAKTQDFDVKGLVMDSNAAGCFASALLFFICFNLQQLVCSPLIKAMCFGAAKAKSK